MRTLILAEKPAAAAKIAAAVGTASRKKEGVVSYYEITKGKDVIIVASAVGHLFTLSTEEKGYPVFDLKWKPTYEVSKSSAFAKKYYNVLAKLSKNVDSIIVATDYDIEGEVIGLNIVKYIFKKDDAKRMKFSTLTKPDLQKAFESVSKTLDWGQAKAGLTRHFLDFIYGVNLSRAATSAVIAASGKYHTVSIGRVQGPALHLLAEREKEIAKFKPEPYWQIFADIKVKSSKFEVIHKEDKFWKSAEAKSIFEKVKNKPGTISDITKHKQAVNPPHPFDLTSLQMEAYRVFKIAPKQTLSLAQDLYTNAYISYPRTSSQKLPAVIGYKKILNALAKNSAYAHSAKEVLALKTLKPNEGKKTDSAHPAIYPTGEIPDGLDARQNKIYDLIVKRFFSVFGEPGARETTTVEFDIAKEPFVLKGTRTVSLGWQKWYAPYAKKEETELPLFKKGEKHSQNTRMDEKETQPPKRYTPASVIRALEKENLGTKATRAAIVDILFQREYIKDTSIVVTKLGMEVASVFEKYAPDIVSRELTGKFESSMDKVREGKLEMESVLKDVREIVSKIAEKFDKHKADIGKHLAEALKVTEHRKYSLGTCWKCKKGEVRIVRSKRTGKRFLACSNYPTCKTTLPLPQGGSLTILNRTCSACNARIISVKSKGRRPWQFCPRLDCPSRKEKEKEKEKAKSSTAE